MEADGRGGTGEAPMIFAGTRDAHDRHVAKILEDRDRRIDSGQAVLDDDEQTSRLSTNFNLVGIRRRLNNIEVGVWVIAVAAIAHVIRHW